MLNITMDTHGFKVAELNAKEGGRVVISDYGAEYITDIGFVSSVNSHGLGGSDWIRNVADIERHIAEIESARWLTEEEQQACIEFLREVAQ